MKKEDSKPIIEKMPREPGVYIMKDASDSIIYIGKAADIRKRVSSYFKDTGDDIKTKILARNISDIDFIVTDNEMEALILENSLIKKHKPRFNIRLKDGKKYPYISVTFTEDYPRIIYTRKADRPGNRYFGPYTDARAARDIISMINSIFRLKTCGRPVPLKKGERPCINFQMGRCSGPCAGEIGKDEYRLLVDNAVRFLEGNIAPVLENLNAMMKNYSEKMRYEDALRIRNTIFDIQKLTATQKVHFQAGLDQDFIGASIFSGEAILVLFEFRSGILLNRKIFIYDNVNYSMPSDIIRSFIIDNHLKGESPPKIVIRQKFDDRKAVESLLTEKSGRRVKISTPHTIDEKGIIRLIQKNIDLLASERLDREKLDERMGGMMELGRLLELDGPVEIMECFDISNIQGRHAVASMVRSVMGLPEKSSYRRYRIRGYDNSNDPGMIHEAVARRIQHLVNENIAFPDVMVIDGGRGQLARAIEAANNFNAPVRIISIAKKFEEIYVDDTRAPHRLPRSSPALKIIQSLRDEAHRFALAYHKKLRDKNMTSSILDDIRGVGPKTKKILMAHFKSVDSIKKACIEELSAVKGINQRTASGIHAYFHEYPGE